MLLIRPDQSLPAAKTDYEAQALGFCRRWLAGESAFELTTSGSTGTPKRLSLTRSQLIASAQMTARFFRLQPGDSALCNLNVNYIAGTMMLVRGLELGLNLAVVEPSANPLHETGTQSFDFQAYVPLQLQTLLTYSPAAMDVLNSAKAILVGGAAVSLELENALQMIHAPVFSTYGMTETVSHIAVRRLNGPHRTADFRVLDDVRIGTDERQCLWVQAAVTNHERVQTNDLVELLSPQSFRLLGRADLTINSGGVKIQLESVERAVERCLRELGETRPFLAWFLPDDRLGQQLVGVWEKELPQALDLQKIETSLRNHLSRYEIPRQWLVSTGFKRTPTGKIDRRGTVEALGKNAGQS